MRNLAKLITEMECIVRIDKIPNKRELRDELILLCIKPSINRLMEAAGAGIENANLKKPNVYRFKLQVHAQELLEQDYLDE
jgi:hypothetical protein